jgi:hypothetical protein
LGNVDKQEAVVICFSGATVRRGIIVGSAVTGACVVTAGFDGGGVRLSERIRVASADGVTFVVNTVPLLTHPAIASSSKSRAGI